MNNIYNFQKLSKKESDNIHTTMMGPIIDKIPTIKEMNEYLSNSNKNIVLEELYENWLEYSKDKSYWYRQYYSNLEIDDVFKNDAIKYIADLLKIYEHFLQVPIELNFNITYKELIKIESNKMIADFFTYDYVYRYTEAFEKFLSFIKANSDELKQAENVMSFCEVCQKESEHYHIQFPLIDTEVKKKGVGFKEIAANEVFDVYLNYREDLLEEIGEEGITAYYDNISILCCQECNHWILENLSESFDDDDYDDEDE